ncbi:translocation/assembly module TamB [Sulfitobacter sabulilitoris]|uniref:Translocation/assembly module TamB n=1 Tax=Sulfitobacter sabulilitoris TaxID=2562655 RepID=A0A5S3PMR9_9RHOB|nr:translocation/assembly module TamB [Sulfitobacter sabulilitoris]
MRIFLALSLSCAAFGARAQDDDRGFLAGLIEGALGGEGREVRIEGFAGALSSEASFDRMTIADADGIWLTLTGARLVWNRSALLRGRLEVERLSAEALELPRLPKPIEEEDLPPAEATGFALPTLPDLPVSVNVQAFEVARIALGAPILGEETVLTLSANARLDDVGANVDLRATRTDAKQGQFAITANLDRDTRVLDLLLNLTEEDDGIAARLLDLPDRPSVDLTVEGQGPLTDFASDVVLSTAGQERLTGQITLLSVAPEKPTETPDQRIQADIGGDITAVIAPQYRDFFGENVQLRVDALIAGDGAINLSDLSMTARAAQLSGQVRLNQEKWPTFIDISGTIANPGGEPVLLPGTDGTTFVDEVALAVTYAAADGEAFEGSFDIRNLTRPEVTIASTRLEMDGTLQGNLGSVGQLLADVAFEATGVALTDPSAAQALGDAVTGTANVNYIEGQPVRISDLDLSGADYGLTGRAVIGAVEEGLPTRLTMALSAQDLSRFAGLAGQDIEGATRITLSGTIAPLAGTFDLSLDGTTQDLAVGIREADALLTGETRLALAARRTEDGTFVEDLTLINAALDVAADAQLRTDNSFVRATARLVDVGLVMPQYTGPLSFEGTASQDTRGWTVDADLDGPYDIALALQGLATGPAADLAFDLRVPQVKPLVPQVEGPLTAQGRAFRSSAGWNVDLSATGPYSAQVALKGLATGGAADLAFDLSLPDVNPLVPQVRGALTAQGRAFQSPEGWNVDLAATGPYSAQVALKGLATGADADLQFTASVPNVQPLVPGVSGPLSTEGRAFQSPEGWRVDVTAQGPYASRVAARGLATGPDATLDFSASMPDVGALVPRIRGPLAIEGGAAKSPAGWRIDTSMQGPSGTQAAVAGLVALDGNLDLRINGSAPLGLSAPFLAPRNLQGQARFDLSVNGPPALSSVTGQISTGNASFSAPNLRVGLTGLQTTVTLEQSRARIDARASVVSGGQVRVGGTVGLGGGLPADLDIALQQVVLLDPRLYRSIIDGSLDLNGPLTGGARIAGRITVGETVVTVPSSGLTSIGDIPDIVHVGAPPEVTATRRRAGVLTDPGAGSDTASGGGAGFALDIEVDAPNRIFVRGRGVDAELGGSLRLTGNTAQIISAGRFELLRGRIDILGQRFDLVEGSVQFQGGLTPFIRFVSATETAAGTVRVILQGPADSPTVTFESTPEAPQDEVLAQLLFGRDISQISAFQALQLANAVATLAGRGGAGLIGNLREGFGLDDLDITTTDDGATAVRAGKYISENIYTDVTAASDGTADVSLNLDLTKSITAKGTVKSDGNTGIGLFFEKDY